MLAQQSEFYVYNFPGLEGRALEIAEELVRHKTNYYGLTVQHIADAITAGKIVIYIIDDPDLDVWFATRVDLGETGVKELIILAVKGKGVFKHGQRLLETWYRIAEHNDCQFIWTQTSEPGVARVLKKFKFLPLSQSFVHATPLGRKQ